jgi:hypothetical protein
MFRAGILNGKWTGKDGKTVKRDFGSRDGKERRDSVPISRPLPVHFPFSLRPGTPVKKRTIPHFPFPPLIFKGFPTIKNLGSFRESSGRNLTYQKIVDFGSWWNSVFKCGNCGNCGNCGLFVD